MRLPPGIRRALRLPSSAERLSRELDDEVRFHIEMRAAELRAQGMSPEDAWTEAMRRFGDRDELRQYVTTIEVSDMRRTHAREWIEGLFQDLRFGTRQFARSRGFFVLASLTLALGIGAATSIFSVVRGVLLRPLPFTQPDRIVQVWQVNNGQQAHFSDPNFSDVKAQSRSFSALAQEAPMGMVSVIGTSEPVRVRAAMVSREYFDVFGVRPLRGRLFAPEEQRVGGAPSVVVSEGFWRRNLGGDDAALGRVLRFDDKPYTVIGVVPSTLELIGGAEVWGARELEPPLRSRTAHNWRVVGRLAAGVTVDQARADVSTIARRLKRELGDDTWMDDATLLPLRDELVGKTRTPLLVLMAGSLLLLLIACANVVNLLIARMASRHTEIALRVALGASRARIARQLFAESLLLAAAAGVTGAGIGALGVKVLLQLQPANLPRLDAVRVDGEVLAFTILLTVATAVTMGLIAAWRSVGSDLRDALAQSQRTMGGSRASERVRRGLVVVQVAMAVVLLVGAGLFMHSLSRLLAVNPGFRVDNQVVVDVVVADEDARVRVYDDLLARFRAIPGVRAAGGVNALPLSGQSAGDGSFVIVGSASDSVSQDQFGQLMKIPERTGSAEYRIASPDYFAALAIPLVRGRLLDERDDRAAPHVAVISASLAAKRWPNEDPIGKVISYVNMDGDPKPITIVGIVGDVRERALDADPSPTVYASYRQRPGSARLFNFVLETNEDPAAIMSAARAAVRDADPTLPARVRAIDAIVSRSVADRRFMLTLVTVFGAAALLLAALGVYSVISYLVAQRSRELSIRIALGAGAGDILRLVLRQGLTLGVVGIVVGTVLALGVSRTVATMLYGITPTDPASFAAVIGVLLLAAALASWLPARRASRVSPNETLREG